MKLIEQNPFRILGVYANASRKEIVANKGKANAFLKVGKLVDYSLDLKGILPTIERTEAIINEADAHLSIAKEYIKYAQFWFVKKTPIDDIAFNHLLSGNIDEAQKIWSKQDSISSLQNKLICYFIEDNISSAIKTAEKLYMEFGDKYVHEIDANTTLKMTGTELLHQFIDSLGDEIKLQQLLSYELNEETRTYIKSQTTGPIIGKISDEIEKTKSVNHKDTKARKNAGQNLINATKDLLKQLKEILSDEDTQYQMIADKLGLEILQCGIDYYNNSDDDNAPHIAMQLQKYAQSVVVGQMAKGRCQENVKILQRIIDNLPPKEVMAEDKAIKKELSEYTKQPNKIEHAVSLLKNTKDSLHNIKKKLGKENKYYLSISTKVVSSALHNVIEEVNVAQKPLAALNKLLEEMGPYERTRVMHNPDTWRVMSNLKDALKTKVREAWNATILMDEFDMEVDFKSHYNQNRNTLKSMCDQMGISTYVSKPAPKPIPDGGENKDGLIIFIIAIIVLIIIFIVSIY